MAEVKDVSDWQRTHALLASNGFEPLLDKLETYVAAEAKNNFLPVDREFLRSIIVESGLVYDGTRYSVDEASRCTFHELSAPLATVIKILKHDSNCDSVFVALGAPASLALSPDQRAVKRAVARYEVLLRDLDKIASAVPPPPRRGKGRPSRKDLCALVERLADYWLRATGKHFTQYWHKGEPLTSSAQFVHAVVCSVDPESLGALPKITEKVVANRRAADENVGTPRRDFP